MKRILFSIVIIISTVFFSGCGGWYIASYGIRSENTKHISRSNVFKIANSLRDNLDYSYIEPDEDNESHVSISLKATADAKEKGFPNYIYVRGEKYRDNNYIDYRIGFVKRGEEETEQIKIVRRAIENAISTTGLPVWTFYLAHSTLAY